MRHTPRYLKIFVVVVASLVGLGTTLSAQRPQPKPKAPKKETKEEPKDTKPKTPAEQALADFNKARAAAGPKDQARFQQVIASGFAYLTVYPDHTSIPGAVTNLAFYGNSIDKKQPALKTAYLSLLKLEATNYKYKEGITDASKAVIVALDAAIADADVRETPNGANLVTMREKIDELAQTPGGSRFLVERERSYTHLVALTSNPARAEAHLQKLAEHKEKAVQTMARTELAMFTAKREPFAYKFTDIEGKPVDFAQLRGKVVGLYFWSTANSSSTKNLEGLKRILNTYKKKGFEMVSVSYDKEEDRAKVTKTIKESRLPWPVYFDGKGAKGELGTKLNATSVPVLYLFDQKGLLQTTVAGSPITLITPALVASEFEPMIKKLLGVK